MKYYQKSLAALSSTLTLLEKESVENITKQFFNVHQYFSTICFYLPQNTQKKKKKIRYCNQWQRNNTLRTYCSNGFVTTYTRQ